MRRRAPLGESSTNGWFRGAVGKPVASLEAEPADQDEVVAILCHLAESVTEQQPVCEAYDAGKKRYVVVTGTSLRGLRVEARVFRDLADFRKFRSDLLALLPRAPGVVVPLSSLNGDHDLLEALPVRSLRRGSTRQARTRDLKSFSTEGTDRWFESKAPTLTAWLKHCMAVVHPNLCLSNDTSQPAVKDITELVTAFLLRGATISLAPAPRSSDV